MMALPLVLQLAIFVSHVTCNGNTAFKSSEFECRFQSVNSSIDHPTLNRHKNFSEEEFNLTQIEGRCFLFCATQKYSSEVLIMCTHA